MVDGGLVGWWIGGLVDWWIGGLVDWWMVGDPTPPLHHHSTIHTPAGD